MKPRYFIAERLVAEARRAVDRQKSTHRQRRRTWRRAACPLSEAFAPKRISAEDFEREYMLAPYSREAERRLRERIVIEPHHRSVDDAWREYLRTGRGRFWQDRQEQARAEASVSGESWVRLVEPDYAADHLAALKGDGTDQPEPGMPIIRGEIGHLLR